MHLEAQLAHAEPKHRFFTWLLLQEKILTADLLQARNWPCNPACPLCQTAPESALHLCLHCPFAQRVWELVQAWTHDLVSKPATDISLEVWWLHSLQNLPRAQKRTKAAVLMYTTWNLWKERNRRIFEGKEAEPSTVLHFVKEEVNLRFRVCGAPDVSDVS